MIAADGVRFDQRQLELGTVRPQRQGGEAAGEPAAKDDQVEGAAIARSSRVHWPAPSLLPMAIALILSALAMTLIVAVRYLLTSGLFAAWTARRFPAAGRAGAADPREIGWSLASAAIYGIRRGGRLGLAGARLDRIYSDAAILRGGCRRRCSSTCWFTMRGFTGRTG